MDSALAAPSLVLGRKTGGVITEDNAKEKKRKYQSRR
jgi:hypothetical protein